MKKGTIKVYLFLAVLINTALIIGNSEIEIAVKNMTGSELYYRDAARPAER